MKTILNSPNLKYAIIIVCISLLGVLFLHWHNTQVESAMREEAAKNEGAILILKQKLKSDSLTSIQLKKTADSAIASIHIDTVFITQKTNAKINTVKHLNADESIHFLSGRLPK